MILTILTSDYTATADLRLIAVRTHTGDHKFFTSLDEFITYFLGTDDKIVIGFNILKFDLPFLLLKSQDQKQFQEFFKKINYANVIDLFTILTFQNKGVIKGLDYHLQIRDLNRPSNDRDLLRNLPDTAGVTQKLDAIHDLYWKIKP